VQSILAGIDASMTDFEKELYLHDALVKRVTYNDAAYAHNAYGALVNGVAVCEGYSEALQILLHRAGIPSFQAYGYANGGPHAWNYVQLDGAWYHTDPTWNDPDDYLVHSYFNISEAMIAPDHSIDACNFPLPQCNSTEAFYYTVKGGAFSAGTYTVEAVAALLKQTPWTANMYITDDVNAFLNWLNANFWNIYEATGATDIDLTQCGYMCAGKEVQFFLTCAHSNITTHAAVAGSCAVPGNELYYTCDACGSIFGSDGATVLEKIPYIYGEHSMVGGFCVYCQAVTADGKHYPSLEAAAQAGCSYARLNRNLGDDIYLNGSVYVDLNGHYIEGDLYIADGATVYLFDSATADYTANGRGGITGMIEGDIAPSCNTPASYGHNYKYLTLVEKDGTLSAHRYYLAVRAAKLYPYQHTDSYDASTVNYKLELKCSDFLVSYIAGWGAKLTGDETVYAQAGRAKGGVNTFVTALVGTVKNTNSESENLYNAEESPLVQGYLRLTDGTQLLSQGVHKSVKELVEYASTHELTDRQTHAMHEMYLLFASILERWGLDLSKFR